MKDLVKTMLFVSVLCLFGCADDPDVSPLKRNTDAVEVAYGTGSAAQFTVRLNGAWEARVVCKDETGAVVDNWFVVTPDQGIGNGKDYQYVTVVAQRNAGEARMGYVYLSPKNSTAEPLEISVKQADGVFSVAKPVITGTLKSGVASAAELVIEYDKAFGGERMVVQTRLSGDASDGLTIKEEYETTIPEEGSGSISIPITGTPSFLGKLVCDVKATLDGREIFAGDVETSVVSSNEIFRMGFDLFVWGGDYLNNKSGVGPNGTSGATKDFMGTEPVNGTITAGSDGTQDIFSTMTETYRINRGVEQWEGSKVYEHPGYLKLGTGSASGWIMTPELSALSSAPETVVLTIDFCRFNNEKGTYYVTAEGAGIVTNGTIDEMLLPAPTNAAGRKWTTLSFTVEGATNKTRIKLSAADLATGGGRLNIDNFVVMGAAKTEVTEQLPAPAADKIVYAPTEDAITYTWEGIKGATGYEVSIAAQAAPDFRKTAQTSGTTYTFEGLAPGFYIFTVKALYADNSAFDSAETTKLSGTAGFATEKLAEPTDLDFTATSSSVKVTWTAVQSASGYAVVLSGADGAKVDEKQVAEPVCEFTGLTAGTSYTVSVRACVSLDGSENEFDSDPVVLAVATVDPQPLTAPAVSLFAKTHGLAVIEWELSEQALAEQPLKSNADTYDFRLKDASGQIVDGYPVENYATFAFARYKFMRFVFGGLKPATSYTMEMRRKSTVDKAAWLDSEWVSVAVTTDAAPDSSNYLLYADFEGYPYGAQPYLCAYGCNIGSGITDYGTQVKFATNGSKNTVYNPTAKWTDATYCAAYVPMWSKDELTDASLCSNVSLAAGVMKLGGGSKPAWVTLPQLTSLGSAADVVLEIDACPYIEPGSGDNAGAMEHDQAACEGLEFFVSVTGATIVEADGKSVNATEATLANVPASEMGGVGAEALRRYSCTGHDVKLSGVTAETRIKIYTALENDKANHRMWLDKVAIRRAE